MGRRTLLLIAALVVAALGTTGVFLYVNGVDKRAEANLSLVQVLVATQPVDAGTTAKDAYASGSLQLRRFLAESVDGLGALSDISTIENKVALSPIAPGEAIVAGNFGSASDTSNLPIPPNKIAVSISVDVPGRVGGFVNAGSEVAIFFTENGASGQSSTRSLLPRVQVIAAGSTTLATKDTSSTAPPTQDSALLTLAVDQADAQKLIFAKDHGTLTLALLTSTSTVDQTAPGTTAQNLFN
jgi:pilus assembly protein CpaB